MKEIHIIVKLVYEIVETMSNDVHNRGSCSCVDKNLYLITTFSRVCAPTYEYDDIYVAESERVERTNRFLNKSISDRRTKLKYIRFLLVISYSSENKKKMDDILINTWSWEKW